MSAEQQPLLPSHEPNEQEHARINHSWRERVAEMLESRKFHLLVIGLISIDSAIVLADLSYTFLSDSCTPEDTTPPLWLAVLSEISLAITILFLLELLLCVWAFGPSYYSPLQSILHFCDGSIIVMTFIVEVVLRGRERELASLLILFRLLRFAAEAAVGVGEFNEGTSKELEEANEALGEKTRALQAAQQEVQMLRARIAASDPDS